MIKFIYCIGLILAPTLVFSQEKIKLVRPVDERGSEVESVPTNLPSQNSVQQTPPEKKDGKPDIDLGINTLALLNFGRANPELSYIQDNWLGTGVGVYFSYHFVLPFRWWPKKIPRDFALYMDLSFYNSWIANRSDTYSEIVRSYFGTMTLIHWWQMRKIPGLQKIKFLKNTLLGFEVGFAIDTNINDEITNLKSRAIRTNTESMAGFVNIGWATRTPIRDSYALYTHFNANIPFDTSHGLTDVGQVEGKRYLDLILKLGISINL